MNPSDTILGTYQAINLNVELITESQLVSRISRKNVCFVMFVDDITLQTLSSEGHMLDRMSYIGIWRIVVVKNLPYTDMRRVGKIPKLLAHRLFHNARSDQHHTLLSSSSPSVARFSVSPKNPPQPHPPLLQYHVDNLDELGSHVITPLPNKQAPCLQGGNLGSAAEYWCNCGGYSIWLDSKLRLQLDPLLVLEYFLWRKGHEYAISNHYDRHCVWEEVAQNKKLNKYNHTIIDQQFAFYQADGLTRFNPFDSQKLLPSNVPEGSFIVREHTPMSNLFSCLWFNEVERFTPRDQLSFAYTYHKLRRINPTTPFYFTMFKDCERRKIAKLFRHRSEESRRYMLIGQEAEAEAE
uniref:TOD1/MUCI70 glycosyltransferase-like domain-containing protein n=1 Tax=Lactuca sativa TaxID=4236 RepID=A0A9R1VVF7_LACSA|nr:hypothetical protein LSAT_V11C400209220 [Lactuca sativa]